jgi:hypothetical protein
MAFSKENPAYPGIGYLLLAGFCPSRTTAMGRVLPVTTGKERPEVVTRSLSPTANHPSSNQDYGNVHQPSIAVAGAHCGPRVTSRLVRRPSDLTAHWHCG